jgi:pentatricopeptide repeat protein
MQIYEQMKAEDIQPDILTYTALIAACSHSGQVEQSMKLYEEMKSAGIDANTRTYAALMRGARLMG